MSFPTPALNAQRLASDPQTSVWVSAHAGSGKTTVLTSRVVRLMLNGTPPGAILCLTYTKAAATNMANRVYGLLGQFATLPDEALREKLVTLGQTNPNLTLARQLFAKALETPGGLKVQTIHAFCEKILHQFPFEANVPADFEIISEDAQAALFENAKQAMLEEADKDVEIKKSLTFLAGHFSDTSLENLLQELLKKRVAFTAWLDSRQSLKGVQQDLEQALGREILLDLEKEVLAKAPFKLSEFNSVADEINHISEKTSDQNLASLLRATSKEPDKNTYSYLDYFITNSITASYPTQQWHPKARTFTKELDKKGCIFYKAFSQEALRLALLKDRINAAKTRDATFKLLTLAHSLLTHYKALKSQRAALDFDDLITATLALFQRIDATWVLYKLDAGIDHILVDEAQDTSPAQWALINALVEGFQGGDAARSTKRTLFVVGDEKQSIFSFQGADPSQFNAMRDQFAQSFKASNLDFTSVPLKYSFRTAQSLLDFVDTVSVKLNANNSLSPQKNIEKHIAAKTNLVGLVELWEAKEEPEKTNSENWIAPLDTPHNKIEELASRISLQISDWLQRGLTLPPQERPIHAGDILILMRRRGPLFHAIISALKAKNVPVAGADRLKLNNHIAVHDLIALGEALLNPHDDYALACVLKSPLFNMTEEELYRLCTERETTLWAHISASDTGLKLEKWREEAFKLPPLLFYATLFAREGVRAQLLSRLGPETGDVLDEFLLLIENLAQEAKGDLRLTLMLLKSRESELKRDMEQAGDAVRVMTVHGAKGLEAEIVFLADTTSPIKGQSRETIYEVEGGRLLWSPQKETRAKPIIEAIAKQTQEAHEEYARLLYVAMTRAISRLVVCALPSKAKNTWHETISALSPSEAYLFSLCPLTKEPIKRWFTGEAYEDMFFEHQKPQDTSVILPEFLLKPLSKTDFKYEAEEVSHARKMAIERGIRIHKKLENLIGKPLIGLDDEIAPIVSRLLAHSFGKLLFATNALAELPIVGFGRVGQVDRLIPYGQKLIVADFKTGFVPQNTHEIPSSHRKQMKNYKHVLEEAFKDKEIVALLVYTDEGVIFEVNT